MKISLGNWTLEFRPREPDEPAPLVPLGRAREMSERELDAAFAVHPQQKLYRAVQQLLATAEDNAHLKSGQFISDPNRVFAEIGAAEICASLQRDFASRRRRGLPAMRFVRPETRRAFTRPDSEPDEDEEMEQS